MAEYDGSIRIKATLDDGEFKKGLSGMETAGSKLGSVLGKLGKAAAVAIGAATTAVGGFAASSVKAGMDFDEAMSQVAAVSGAAGDDFDKLRDKAIEMGSKTKFSATESAEAFNYMAMAGWKTEDMLNGIEGIMSLAAASGEDLALTSDIVTDALTAFGMGAEDSGHFADVLAAASANANTNVAMLGETFKYVAPVAGALGYSAEDTAIAVGLMANSGIKASQAGTSLRAALTNMVNPTDKMAGVMDKYGISLTDSEGNMKSLGEVMKDLREKMGGLDDATQASAAATLFGKEAMSGMLAIINASDEDFQKLTDSIYGASDAYDGMGEAAHMAAEMQDNLAGDITIFKSALEGAQIAISDKLTPSLRDFVQFGTEGVSKITEAFKKDGLSGAMDAFGEVLSDGLDMIIGYLPQFVDAGMQILGAIGQGIMDNLQVILDAAMEIISIIAKGIMDNLPAITDAAVQIISFLAQGLADALPDLVPAIVDILLKIVDIIIENLPVLVEAGVQIIGGLIIGLIKAIPDLIAAIPKIVTALIDGFKNLLGIHSPSTVFADIGKNLVDGLLQGIKDTWDSITKFFGEKLDAIKEAISTAWANIKQTASEKWEEITTALGEKWDSIKKKAVEKYEEIKAKISEAWENIKSTAKEKWEAILSDLGEKWETLKGTAIEKFTAIKDRISEKWAALKEDTSEKWDNIKQTLGETWDNLKEDAGTAFENIKTAITNAWESVKTSTKNIWEGIKNAVKGPVNAIIGFIEKMVNTCVKGLNFLIGGLNKLHFDIPDNPITGEGFKLGFDIKKLDQVTLPRLANGAVIPPNQQFAAILGDQRSGMNLEGPENMFRKIVREEIAGSGGGMISVADLRSALSGMGIYMDSRRVGELVDRYHSNVRKATAT